MLSKTIPLCQSEVWTFKKNISAAYLFLNAALGSPQNDTTVEFDYESKSICPPPSAMLEFLQVHAIVELGHVTKAVGPRDFIMKQILPHLTPSHPSYQ